MFCRFSRAEQAANDQHVCRPAYASAPARKTVRMPIRQRALALGLRQGQADGQVRRVRAQRQWTSAARTHFLLAAAAYKVALFVCFIKVPLSQWAWRGMSETSYFRRAKRPSNTGTTSQAISTQPTHSSDRTCKCSIILVLHWSGMAECVMATMFLRERHTHPVEAAVLHHKGLALTGVGWASTA